MVGNRGLAPGAPADEDQHDHERDHEAVLRVDVADDELLEDAEDVAADQREPDRRETAEDGGGEAVDGDRDARRVGHRVARCEERPGKRRQPGRDDERDHCDRADVEADELGGATRVGAGDERLADDRPVEEERQSERSEERDRGDEHVLRLHEDVADVPGMVGDPRIRAWDVAERQQERRLGDKRCAEGDDQAGQRRRATTEAEGENCQETPGHGSESDRHGSGEPQRQPFIELKGERERRARRRCLARS